jgi:DNA polymerase, archaea type
MDPILFGADAEQNIIACYQLNDKIVRVYKKQNAKVFFEDREFFPFFFISDITLLDNYKNHILKKKLNGTGYYKYLCVFPSWSELKEAYNFVLDNFRKGSHPDLKDFNEINLKNDPVAQYLLEYGKTLFKGMNFSEMQRCQIEFITRIHPKDDSKEIMSIILTDNTGWTKTIDDKQKPESKKIEEFIKLISEKDPDIIEGYNLYNGILELLIKKCNEYNIELNIGRGSLPVTRLERISRNDYDFEKNKVVIPGRHFVDIIDLVSQFDYIKKIPDLNSLEKIASFLDLNSPVSSSPASQDDIYKNCNLVCKICEKLLPELFYMNRFISYNLGRVLKLTHPQKIDTILYREYLKQRYALPSPEKTDPSSSGISEIYYSGVLCPIVSCSIENLYQNSILQSEVEVAADPLKLFKSSLKKILELQKPFTNETGESEVFEPAFISSMKNLSTGYFHYINNPWVGFNSKELAYDALKKAKESVDKINKYIGFSGGIPIQVDNEDIIFVPPRDITNEELEYSFIAMLAKKVIEVEGLTFKFRARRALSYKKKNLAFLLYNNKIVIKSNLLLSRNVEKFGRRFLLQSVDLLLNNRIDDLHKLYNSYYHNIIDRKFDITDLMRTEVLKESLAEYEEGVKNGSRNRLPYYQLALASGKSFKLNSKIIYYVISDEAAAKRMSVDVETTQRMQNLTEGILETKINPRDIYLGCENMKLAEEWNSNFRDENVDHYVKRLNDLSERLQILFSHDDFKNIFSVDDLFTYSLEKVKIRTVKIEPGDTGQVVPI